MSKKYALHPGVIISKSDGEEHYIPASRLAQLYEVDGHDCIVWDSQRPETFLGRKEENYIHLYPRTDGKYALP